MGLIKRKYKKTVELPTDVRTEISDKLTGLIAVHFDLEEIYSKPVKKAENENNI